ncbi:MAG TPA: chromate efflux transporter [Methylibium sp.]|uniref:chromate efflux transporter n=1 Tax=Methylibium sp. TaxID=2067992 RepID=UPI002DBF9868|nr:chromate efflux transporter [Methylibium sp.]HEU4460305.1 chromate efflux transporter [Methylibium sp.]
MPPDFREALRWWFKLGCIGFGGPAGQIALMHAELVERRRWISERRFLHALNYCMLLPGPEAQQLATYIGWLMHRTAGGLAAGLLFVAPSLVLLIALSWLYAAQGGQPWLQALLYGVQPAVVALVVQAAWRLGGKALKTPLHVALAIGSLAAMVAGVPFPLVLLVAALAGWAQGRRRPPPPSPPVHAPSRGSHAPAWIDDDTPSPPHALGGRARLLRVVALGLALGAAVFAALVAWRGLDAMPAAMAAFFTKAALLTFGGAYAVLPYVVQGAVEQHGWLSGAQMLAGLALGESTPGPLIMIVAFVGFLGGWQQPFVEAPLLAGVIGAGVASFFTFLPSFVFILAGAPLVEATRDDLRFTAPLAGISAAVVGVIAQLGLYFAGQVFWPQGPAAGGRFDAVALLIAVAAAVALIRLRLGVLPVLAACAVAGIAMRSVSG